jgi:hypothetical protein
MYKTLYQIVVDGRKYHNPDYDTLIRNYPYDMDYINPDIEEEYKLNAFKELMDNIEELLDPSIFADSFKTYDDSNYTFTISKRQILQIIKGYIQFRAMKYTMTYHQLKQYLEAETLPDNVLPKVDQSVDSTLYGYDSILAVDAYGEFILDLPLMLLNLASAEDDAYEITFRLVNVAEYHI